MLYNKKMVLLTWLSFALSQINIVMKRSLSSLQTLGKSGWRNAGSNTRELISIFRGCLVEIIQSVFIHHIYWSSSCLNRLDTYWDWMQEGDSQKAYALIAVRFIACCLQCLSRPVNRFCLPLNQGHKKYLSDLKQSLDRLKVLQVQSTTNMSKELDACKKAFQEAFFFLVSGLGSIYRIQIWFCPVLLLNCIFCWWEGKVCRGKGYDFLTDSMEVSDALCFYALCSRLPTWWEGGYWVCELNACKGCNANYLLESWNNYVRHYYRMVSLAITTRSHSFKVLQAQ